MRRSKILSLFESRKAHLDSRIRRDYIRNGIATIPCRVTDYSDVISTYSVKGYETLNPDFTDYLTSTAEVTPPECPLVLNIIGDCLSDVQKSTIERIVRDDMAYDLGMVEQEDKRHTKTFFMMFFGFILSGLVLWFTEPLADEPREIFFILFWFMGESLCDYIFLTGHDLRCARRLAGRLASIQVVFSDRYEDKEWTSEDVNKLYSEIEQEVNESIQEESVPDLKE